MATHYKNTSSPATTNANNNEMNASEIADVAATFGQQGPAVVESPYHPQEARILQTASLDMESSTTTTVAVTTKNSTASELDATTTASEVETRMARSDEGLLSNNVVANESDKTSHLNKFNYFNNNINNNNDDGNYAQCNNNSSSSTVVDISSNSGRSGDNDIESEERINSESQCATTTTDPLTLPTFSPTNNREEASSFMEAAREESMSIGASSDYAPNNSLAPSACSSTPSSSSSFSSTGPAEAPTTRSTPTRRSTPIPSLELQPEVTFQQLQQERHAGISSTPTTTPTSAIMRTPPSPRAATVILPLPRVTVTSPSDLSPPCNGSNTTLTMDEEDTVTHSPPSPQSPTSPTIPLTPPPTPPPPPHRSVVIIPMATNPMLTTGGGMVGIGLIEQPQDMIDMPPPPPYEGLVKTDDPHRQSGNYNLSHMDTLPSYAVATDLPTYEEAERAKANEMRENPLMSGHDFQNRDPTTASHLSNSTQQSGGSRYPDDERVPAYDPYHLTGVSIGTDWIFLCTFAISFLFNWLGFLISLCITNTVAGRCGALSGLGLSMVKWVVIMKHNTMAQGFLQGDSWVWWILMVCGFLLFLRGCIQYVNMKYEWKRIFSRLQQMYFS